MLHHPNFFKAHHHSLAVFFSCPFSLSLWRPTQLPLFLWASLPHYYPLHGHDPFPFHSEICPKLSSSHSGNSPRIFVLMELEEKCVGKFIKILSCKQESRVNYSPWHIPIRMHRIFLQASLHQLRSYRIKPSHILT